MLMGDVVYVKPASRESRLVMVRLEPKAKKKPKREKQNKTKGDNEDGVHKEDRPVGLRCGEQVYHQFRLAI